MRRGSRIGGLVTVALAALAALAIGPVRAQADFTPEALISGCVSGTACPAGSIPVEADFATQPAISPDGRFVAYGGSQAGAPGIYLKDLQTGGVYLVTAGSLGIVGDPSVSADGRAVAFTSTVPPSADPPQGLTPSAPTQCSQVYVADMSDPTAPTYTLASARDGGAAPLRYAGDTGANAHRGGACPGGGSAAAGRVAISADGNEVAFTVVGQSDLMNGAGLIGTPPAQVAVRVLTTQSTTLVSRELPTLGAGPVPAGAAITDVSAAPDAAGSVGNSDPGDSTASISADGTTVAWLGVDIPAQAPAGAEAAPMGWADEYDEPLWRRLADGSAATTRRVIGGDDPVCGCQGPLDTNWSEQQPRGNVNNGPGPDAGSLINFEGFGSAGGLPMADGVPNLSADGQTVAVLSSQPAAGQDPCLGLRAGCSPNSVSTNVYIVDMAPGLSRGQAMTRLTEWAGNNLAGISTDGPIDGLAISPEGDRVAFVSARSQFPYAPPALITAAPPSFAGDTEQLYVADVAGGTLELVSTGYDGQPANGVVSTPGFSAGDGPIVFASSASNLVYGALSDQSAGSGPSDDEVFTTTELTPPTAPGLQSVGAVPASPPIIPRWVITARVIADHAGGATVQVSVPGAGRLTCSARAGVPAGPASASQVRRSAHDRHRARGGSHARAAVITRTLTRAGDSTGGAGVVALRLRPGRRYRSLITRARGLYATIIVRFTARGYRPLSATLPVEFAARPRRSTRSHHRPSRVPRARR